MTNLPSFSYEVQYWEEGVGSIAGVDEVGMGALAGPVVAAAVVFARSKFSILNFEFSNKTVVIRDSKTMTVKQREKACEWIKEEAMAWAAGEASVEEIDKINIRQASHLAMRRAVDALSSAPELLLVDGLPAQIHPGVPTVNIVNGDSLCFSIAAASIVAKVYRDGIMVKLSDDHPEYGWDSNKGYGSLNHRTALRERGVTEYHRRSYAPVAKLVQQE